VITLTLCIMFILSLAIVGTLTCTTRVQSTRRWHTRSWPRLQTALLTLCLLGLPLLMTACGGAGKSGY
jgi:hypothetical protein